jgi:hypothetical protein
MKDISRNHCDFFKFKIYVGVAIVITPLAPENPSYATASNDD